MCADRGADEKRDQPALRSCSICRASASGRIANFSSTSISRRFSLPDPGDLRAFFDR